MPGSAVVMAELVDTVLTVAWALAGWVVFLATVAAILVTAAAATGAWAARGTWRWLQARLPRREPWRGLGAPQGPSRGSRDAGDAPEPARARTELPRRTPAWACTQPINHEEAA